MANIIYNAPPTVGAFMRDSTFLRGLMGPFGSGKSVGCVFEGLRRAMEQAPDANKVRRTRSAIIRNTYPELRDTTRATFEEWMPEGKNSSCWLEQEFSFTLRMPLRDGTSVESEFLFRALDRPEHVKKLLSLELTWAWINEAREVPYSVVKMLAGRVGRFPSMRDGGPTWSGIFMDTNPPDDDSWWYKLFEEEKPQNARVFKQPGGRDRFAENLGHWEDNSGNCIGHYPWDQGAKWLEHVLASPNDVAVVASFDRSKRWVRHLKPEYYSNLALVNGSDPLWVKVHVDAQYGPVKKGKPIYPEFRDDLHVVDAEKLRVIPGAELLLGQDFGLTPALVLAQRDPKDGQVQVLDELVADDLGAVRFFEDAARHLKSEYRGHAFKGTGDPGGDVRSQVDERTPYDVAAAQGIPLVPAHTNDFELRREAVARPLVRLTILGRPALIISSKCKVLRKAMNGGYCLRRIAAAGEERFKEVPDKNHFSHVAEALQYLMLGEGEDAAALVSVDPTARGRKPKVKTAGMRRGRGR